MAEYLLPSYEKITIEEQRNIFSIRNQVVAIPSNFNTKKEDIFVCSKIENMKQIHQFEFWNKENNKEKPTFRNAFW